MAVQRIRIDEINFGNRFRKEFVNLDGLAASIKAVGLLNPVTVAKVNGGYQLLAGARRVRACRDTLGMSMIEANVVKFESALEKLLVEREENEQREPFKPSERFNIGKAIEEQLAEHGERRGRPKKETCANAHVLEPGITREIAAEAAGFTSDDAYERTKKVVEQGTPELIKAMDDGTVSISDAAAVADAPAKEQRKAVQAVKEGKSRTAKAAVTPKKPKPGKVVHDDVPIDQTIGRLTRMFDVRGGALGKSKEYQDCLDAMGKVLAAWRRWQKAST